MPRVYSKRKGAEAPPRGAIYVGRPSAWGNPFIEQAGFTRDEACERFAQYAAARLEREPHWLDPLRGKDLVCWCAPRRCHADTLLQLANREEVSGSCQPE